MLLPIDWRTSVVKFVHINEVKGGFQSPACLVIWDPERRLWDKEITTVGGNVVIDGQDLGFSGKSEPGDWPLL